MIESNRISCYSHHLAIESQFLPEQTNKTVLLWVRVCGFPIPWLDFSKLISSLLTLYDVLVFLFSLYIIACATYSIYVKGTFQDLCQLGIVVSQMSNGILITFHYIAYKTKMLKITMRMDRLTEEILSSPLGQTEDFRRTIQSDRSLITLFTKCSIVFNVIASLLYVLPMPLMDYLTDRSRTRLPIPISFLGQSELDGPIFFELMVLQEVFALIYSSIKKIGNDCIFLSFFKIQSAYIKYLIKTMKSLGEDLATDSGVTKEKLLNHWISLHQNVIQCKKDLVSLYAPLIVLYYTNLICILALGVFVFLKGENDRIQSTAVALWISTLIFVLYLQSAVADELGEESNRLAETAYFIPWYRMRSRIGHSLRLVILSGNHPLHITAYRATAFILNKETFLGFIANVITVYMGFSKIDDILKENQ